MAERIAEAAGAPADGQGTVDVVFQVASVAWLVRHVLYFGDEAEVIAPPAYREAVRRAAG